METQQQTSGDAITVSGQKPMLNNSIVGTVSLSMPKMLTAPITIDPEKSLLWDPYLGPSSLSKTYT